MDGSIQPIRRLIQQGWGMKDAPKYTMLGFGFSVTLSRQRPSGGAVGTIRAQEPPMVISAERTMDSIL
jgi:hypothetical protein